MTKKIFHLTEEGIADLMTELEDLKSQRGEIADKIASARDFGDLSENAEYDAARSEQSMVESRIAEIEEIMLNAKVIKNGRSNQVSIGSVVVVIQTKTSKEVEYQLVGPVEADPLEGKISDESPLGKALLGKKPGDKFKVSTPRGDIEYQVKTVG